MPKSKISCLPSSIQDELNERLSQNERRLQQADEKLALQRDVSQREAVSFGLRVLHDVRAKEIDDDPAVSHEQRIEILGQHMFGDLWIPRNIPGVVSLSPEQVAALQATGASRMPAEPATPKADGGLEMGGWTKPSPGRKAGRSNPAKSRRTQLRWIEQN